MNNKNNAFALTLDSDAFGALKDDFNTILTRTLMNMEERESETAEITVKVKIISTCAGENIFSKSRIYDKMKKNTRGRKQWR